MASIRVITISWFFFQIIVRDGNGFVQPNMHYASNNYLANLMYIKHLKSLNVLLLILTKCSKLTQFFFLAETTFNLESFIDARLINSLFLADKFYKQVSKAIKSRLLCYLHNPLFIRLVITLFNKPWTPAINVHNNIDRMIMFKGGLKLVNKYNFIRENFQNWWWKPRYCKIYTP